MDMENKKSRRILFRTLLAVSTLLVSQQVFAYGCKYDDESSLSNATIANFATRPLVFKVGADAFIDNLDPQTQYPLGEYYTPGEVRVKCGETGLRDVFDAGYKRQGYTLLTKSDEVPGHFGLYKSNIEGIGVLGAMTNNTTAVFPIGWESIMVRYEDFYEHYPVEKLDKGNFVINGGVSFVVKVYDINKLPPAGEYVIDLSKFKAKMVYGAHLNGTDNNGQSDDDGGSDGYDAKITTLFSPGTATVKLINSSCELLTHSIQVDLGKISPSMINPVSDTLAKFNIELAECPREITVDYKFVNDDKDIVLLNNTILIPDNEPGSATGVGIQISQNVSDTIFDPLRLNYPKGAGSTGYTLAVERDTDPTARGKFRNVTIPLKARYRRLHDHIPVTGGKVKATAHFEVHYH
ncbi:fimbrial protein [Enterobacter sp.]|uniref:fimbrial protein n=1 Tax=Enterobacter sp. TaxID=42895 RepID=UPI00296EAE6B|nr:fimbrial protein [Enterobacter sp.]